MQNKTEKYWVSDLNQDPELLKNLNIPERVWIADLTLREGDQTVGCVFNAKEKIEIAKDLDDLGVDEIQMFAMVSEDDREAFRELSKPGVLKHAELTSLARLSHKDIDTAAACGARSICLEGPGNLDTARIMGMPSADAVIDAFVDNIKYAKSLGLDVKAGIWDMTRDCPLSMLERFCKETVAAGSNSVYYADTYGFSMPWTVDYIVRKMRSWVGKDTKIVVHLHNDYGLATVNTLVAIAAGADAVECAMNGLGERVGNVATDEIAINLALNMGVKTNIDIEKLYPLSKKIESISKIPIGGNKPFTGGRNFTMGSGIIVDWLGRVEDGNADITNFLPFDPSLIGRPPYEVAYGKGVGRNMTLRKAKAMGFDITKEQAYEIAELIKTESLITKDAVPEYQVERIIRDYLK